MSDYKEFREEEKARKRIRATRFNKIIEDLIILFEIEVEVIQDWHLRFHFPKGCWDFYTTKGRGSWTGSNGWYNFSPIGLEDFIRKQYPDHPENKGFINKQNKK